jgi:hypothetical protein
MDASARNRWATAALRREGEARGFRVQTEFPTESGRIDVVWLTDTLKALHGCPEWVPVVGFEIESSWRTRKHVKGDLHNLVELGASVGVIVLLGGADERLPSLVAHAQQLAERSASRILIWTDDDVQALSDARPAELVEGADGTVAEGEERASTAVGWHTGKYRALWQWLRGQGGTVETTFSEIEEVLGFPLPASCRTHAAHWSSYDGSAVARAIHDAGYRARKVDLHAETLTLAKARD